MKLCKIFCVQAINILALSLLLTVRSFVEAGQYDIISKKNLFRPDRSEWIIEKQDSKKTDKKVDPDKLELRGTIIVGDEKSALIYNRKAKAKGRRSIKAKKTKLYSPGDYMGGYIISAIDEGRVILDFYGEKETLYLHEDKESSEMPPPPSPAETHTQKISNKQKAELKKKASKMQAMLKSGKIPEAFEKSPYFSKETLKKVLEFNKEIMKEVKESGGNLDQEAIKERVEQFREQLIVKLKEMKE